MGLARVTVMKSFFDARKWNKVAYRIDHDKWEDKP